MKKLLAVCTLALPLLAGCQQRDDETKKQLAALQEQLAQQQKIEAERLSKEEELKREQQMRQREEEIYRQAQEDLKIQQQWEEEEKNAAAQQKKNTPKNNTAQTNQPNETEATAATSSKVTEKLARYSAFVITESGYGQLNLRGSPSANSVKVTQLNDGDPVQVIATTNKCTPQGCWVKVQVGNITGYVNDAYLQRGEAPQKQRQPYTAPEHHSYGYAPADH